jgi:hypothetical protein
MMQSLTYVYINPSSRNKVVCKQVTLPIFTLVYVILNITGSHCTHTNYNTYILSTNVNSNK